MTPYLQAIADDVERATALADEPTKEVAGRLLTMLEPSLRLAMTQLLSDAAAEVSSRLTTEVVTVRMDGRTPQLQVQPTPDGGPAPGPDAWAAAGSTTSEPAGDTAEDGTARVTVRLSEQLKRRAEHLAQAGNQSLNAWIVQALRAATTTPTHPGPGGGSRRVTGWA